MAKDSKKLLFREVVPQVNVDELEQGILDYWDKEKVFDQVLEQTKDGELFTFYDGPPYATGKPHYGHVLQSAIKDTVLRYKTMQGYYVPRRVGWDCHGLPVENLVEKEFGIKSKKEIEDDIEGFNKKCREMVFRYIDDFTAILKRVGRWADYSSGYATLDRDYMESEWWVFKQLWDQDLIYKSFRSTPYCIRCATPLSNFEVSMAYKDKKDTAVYVEFAVSPISLNSSNEIELRGANKKLSLLVWTTTPWTLPANVAVAISPEIKYVTVGYEGREYILAQDRVEAIFGKEAVIEREWNLNELRQLTYEPLYESNLSPAQIQTSFRVVVGAHVTGSDGTGIVHMAPAFGEEDFEVAKQEGLPILRTVGTDGKYLSEVPLWADKQIFVANEEIIADLEKRELLFRQEKYTHSYPFCWRCDTPLIYYALDSWFVKVSNLKEAMLESNNSITWVPAHVKYGRFAKGIESAPDWCISRNRFWSVPMPVWVCNSCGEKKSIGSVKELQEASQVSDEKVEDIHRPFVDDITWACNSCKGGTMTRIPEVLDVWFDSGSMPYSQRHYPFENKELVEKGFPADFIAESIEMTRAWFYSLHVLSTALTNQDIGLGLHSPAFKNVIASGLIFAPDGQKLSKKLKNYPDVEPTLQVYGADVLRFYLLTSTSLGEPYRFSEKELQQLKRNTYLTLWNMYSFFVRYANLHEWQFDDQFAPSTNMLDRWVLARVKELREAVRLEADAYRIDTAARLFIPFINDLSNWYVRRSRSRLQKPESEEELNEALSTLYQVLVQTATALAPFMPFVTEEIFRNVTGKASVHLELANKEEALTSEEAELLMTMKNVREVVASGLALRAKAKIKVRQPLLSLHVAGNLFSGALTQIIADEVNVKKVEFGSVPKNSNYVLSEKENVALCIELTPELKAEGIMREIIRHGQMLRRGAGYALTDYIILVLNAHDESLQAAIKLYWDNITETLKAADIVKEGQEDMGEDVVIQGKKMHIGVKKVKSEK